MNQKAYMHTIACIFGLYGEKMVGDVIGQPVKLTWSENGTSIQIFFKASTFATLIVMLYFVDENPTLGDHIVNSTDPERAIDISFSGISPDDEEGSPYEDIALLYQKSDVDFATLKLLLKNAIKLAYTNYMFEIRDKGIVSGLDRTTSGAIGQP
jgi:hypothetical protein